MIEFIAGMIVGGTVMLIVIATIQLSGIIDKDEEHKEKK